MRGEVKPGALCLVVGKGQGQADYWLGVTVRVAKLANPIMDFNYWLLFGCYPKSSLWDTVAADGIPRLTSGGASTMVTLEEHMLMPLDPDADVKTEPDLYGIPASSCSTDKVPVRLALP